MYREKLLEMVEEGLLDKDLVIMACVKYMSDADVTDMMKRNEFWANPMCEWTDFEEEE